jgi:predicted nucleic acid-binding protein
MINSQQFTIRLTDDQKTVLNREFPDLTQKEIFENVFNAFNNPKQSDNSNFIAEIQQLKDEKEVEIRCLNETIDFLNRKIAELEARAPEVVENRVEVAIEKERELSENELLLQLPEPCRKLLFEYAKRLETTADNLLIYTFFRYCVERYTLNMWDFTVIDKREFKDVCGLPYSEIKKMLNV